MTLARHTRRHPVTGPVAMEETHISFGGEVTFFLFVVGPLGPPPSLARFASLELELPPNFPRTNKHHPYYRPAGLYPPTVFS